MINQTRPVLRRWSSCGAGRFASFCLFTVIVSLCIGLCAEAPIAGAQRPRSSRSKSHSVQQGKTVPQRKAVSNVNSGLPATGKPMPACALSDTEGQTHTLAEFKGRPIALYFFCGCERCQRCALTWAQLQQGGALVAAASAVTDSPGAARATDAPKTVIVFMGDAEAARAFAADTRLNMKQTLLIPDPKLTVTQKAHALPCPRAFALDDKGVVRYVNSHKDDSPLKASAATIVTRTLEAMTGVGQTRSGRVNRVK